MSRSVPQTSYPAINGAGFDKCWTPWHGAAPLLKYLKPRSRIWECCAGDGWLAQWLEEAGHTVIQTDYVTGHDALTWAPDPDDYDIIITNPPWSLKYKFLRRFYELGKPWAMLVPYATPHAAGAKKIRDEFGAAWEEMRLDKRINFHMSGSGFQNAGAQLMSIWLCYKLLPTPIVEETLPDPRPEHRLIKPPKKRKLTQEAVEQWLRREGNGKLLTPELAANLIMQALDKTLPVDQILS